MNHLRFMTAKVILFYDMCKKNRSETQSLEAMDTRQIRRDINNTRIFSPLKVIFRPKTCICEENSVILQAFS